MDSRAFFYGGRIMNLRLELLKKEEIDLFNRGEERAFDVHAKYFEDGLIPKGDEEEHKYEPEKLLDNPKFTLLSIKDGEKFIGGAIVEKMEKNVFDIGIFYLIVEYQAKGIGKQALDMIEEYFSYAKKFTLITPSQVLQNTVFYINKCGYNIVKVIDFDREKNTADFIFEKKNPYYINN